MWSVLYLLHTSRESQSRQGLLKMMSFRPNIGDQDSVAVATNRVLEKIGQLALTVGHVVALFVGRADDNLLKEGQTSVDVAGLSHSDACCSSLLGALVTCQVNEVELGSDDLLRLFNGRS